MFESARSKSVVLGSYRGGVKNNGAAVISRVGQLAGGDVAIRSGSPLSFSTALPVVARSAMSASGRCAVLGRRRRRRRR
eukprot:1005909-Pleurochrysis_carterae.AAC.1